MDGTGPEGKGAKTGRKLGCCEPSPEAEQESELGKVQGKNVMQVADKAKEND